MICYIVKTKKVQSYNINKLDLLYVCLLGVGVLIVSYINFGFPLDIKYETGDPAAHYLTSEMFTEDDAVLAAGETDPVYGSFKTRKIASYVNSGLIMKCFEGVTDSFYNYVIFILFGIFILFLTSWMFYSTIAEFSKNKITRFIAFVVALLYTMGYPLNSLLFGFEYLSMGILVLGAIVACIDIYHKEEIGFKQNLLVFFLLNFGLFLSYYMFVPYVYSALWICFMLTEKKRQNKWITLKTAVMLTVTLLLPFGLGYIYCLAPNIYSVIIKSTGVSNVMQYSEKILNSGFAVEGYIYVNLFSNMLLLLPFAFWAMYKNWNENKATGLMVLFDIAFITLLLVGTMFKKVSIYYVCKNYYALWFLLFYLSYKGLIISYEKKKWIPYVCVGGYVVIVLINLIFFETEFTHGKVDTEENALQVADIYGANKTILKHQKDLTQDEIALLKYVQDNIPEDKTIDIAGESEQGYWAYVMLRRLNDDDEHSGERKIAWKIKKIGEKAGKVDYIIFFNRGYYYQYWKDALWENAELVYENEAGGILKYQNNE
jgi:hypothetical protein